MVSTSKLFCPKCGSETEEEGLCKACFKEKYVVFEVPQVIEAKICAKCPSFKIGSAWVDTSIKTYEELAKKAADRTVRLAMNVNKEVSKPQITVYSDFINPNILKMQVSVTGEIQGRPVATDAEVEARIRKETCDVCSRIAGGYYEGTIQVRAEGRFPTEKEVKRCLKIIEDIFVRAAKSGDRLAFITDIFPLPEGADLYIGSNISGRSASRAIVDEMGGTVTESPKLVGAKEGKDLYRITFAVRLPNIVAGDIVRMHGKPVLIEKVGKRISGTDLTTGHSTSTGEDAKLDKIANRSDAVKTVVVSMDEKSVQILDPETYETVTIKKPAFLTREAGDEAWAVKIKDGIFLLPGGSRGKE